MRRTKYYWTVTFVWLVLTLFITSLLDIPLMDWLALAFTCLMSLGIFALLERHRNVRPAELQDLARFLQVNRWLWQRLEEKWVGRAVRLPPVSYLAAGAVAAPSAGRAPLPRPAPAILVPEGLVRPAIRDAPNGARLGGGGRDQSVRRPRARQRRDRRGRNPNRPEPAAAGGPSRRRSEDGRVLRAAQSREGDRGAD